MVDEENSRDSQEAPADLALARTIRDLDRQIQPTRDLWPGIERNIVAHPHRDWSGWTQRWMPYGVAASLIIATAALVLNLVKTTPMATRLASFEPPMANMQAAYVKVRNPLMQQFVRTNRGLDPVTMDDLYRNFEIMENARREIERQLRTNPHDQRLIGLLMKVHEQELDLLKQNYTEPGHSM